MIDGEIRGLLETQRKFEQVIVDLTGPPMLDAMRQSVLWVQNDAKREAPVDTGRLRASITPEVNVRNENIVEGIVGSNVEYAPYMELGTGVFAGNAAYFPPPSALDVWARRHGMGSGYMVALAIFRAGGTKPRRFLQTGFEKNQDRIIKRFEDATGKIVQK